MVFPLTITILTKILTSSIVFWVYWQHGDGTKWHVHSLVKNGKFLTKSYRIPTIKCMTGFYGRIRQVIDQMFIHSSDYTLVINLLPDTAPNAINQSRKAVANRVPGSRKGTSTACVPGWYWQLQRNSNQSKADYTPTTLTRYPRESSLTDQNVAFQ